MACRLRDDAGPIAWHDRAHRQMVFVNRTEWGTWLIHPDPESTGKWELLWYGQDGSVERCAKYHDPKHAAGAVESRVTGHWAWDEMAEAPPAMGDISSWESADESEWDMRTRPAD